LKYIIILLLAKDPIYVPFDTALSCHKQGREIMESIATYYGPGPDQGWYTKKGDLVFGFYCE